MFNTQLTSAEYQAYVKTLLGNHEMRVDVQVMDTSEKVLAELGSDYVIDGQVNVDGANDVTRQASLTLFDPDHKLAFDSNAPTDGALFLDRMIRINYSVRSDDFLPEWVTVPIFTGFIMSMNRNNAVIQIECQGKEVFAKQIAGRTKNYAVGSLRTAVIKELLTNVGEKRFNLENWTKKTADPYGVTFESDVWDLAKRMGAGKMFYYDAAGVLTLRPYLTRSLFTFATGDDGSVLSYPEISYDVTDVKNIVRVKGGIPKGGGPAVVATAYAPKDHPLSAHSLGRNGYARRLFLKVEDSDLLSEEECQERADYELNKLLTGQLNASFDSIPIPHLEFGDVVTLKTDDFSFTFAVDQFSIPLTAGSAMSVGQVKKCSVMKSRIRKKTH